MGTSSNMLLKNGSKKKEIKGDIQSYIETNKNDNMTYQNFWDTANAVIRGKFLSLQAYLRKKRKIPSKLPNITS